MQEDIPADRFVVLVNAEDQYGLHPAELAAPNGWATTGVTGSADECAAWVDDNWRDLRPLSLRSAVSSR